MSRSGLPQPVMGQTCEHRDAKTRTYCSEPATTEIRVPESDPVHLCGRHAAEWQQTGSTMGKAPSSRVFPPAALHSDRPKFRNTAPQVHQGPLTPQPVNPIDDADEQAAVNTFLDLTRCPQCGSATIKLTGRAIRTDPLEFEVACPCGARGFARFSSPKRNDLQLQMEVNQSR